MALDPGYYANLFEVTVPTNEKFNVMVCQRCDYPSLKELREKISKRENSIFVYAPEHSEVIYGYGKDMKKLESKGFLPTTITFSDEPRLTGRMILDSFIEKSKEIGYFPSYSKEIGRCRLFNWEKFQSTSDGNVKVFTGFDIRVIFLKDQERDSLSFNVIIDACYSLKGRQNEPLNYQTIVTQFGSNILKEVRQIQGDLIPTGINTEVSRKRLLQEILPFLESNKVITLPCGLCAELSPIPSRIIVGEESESVW